MPPPVGPQTPTRMAGFDRQIDVAQHRRSRVVGKGDVLENDLALELARIARVGLLRDDRVGFEDRLHALQTDCGLRDDVRHFRQILHRLEELVQIGEEDRQRADGHGVFQNQSRAAPEHKGHAHATVTETMGESSDFTRRALSAASTVSLARLA